MSRSADRAGRARDGGFTLIEIIVALGILSTVLVALLPQLIVGIKATGTARLISQAKGVSSGQLERMRNLPFNITPAAGDFRDVLDNYFPDLDPPSTSPVCPTGATYTAPTTGWSGYVAPGGARCAFEPATGAFHRVVTLVPAGSGIAGYALVVDTQFLSAATPPVPVRPAIGYDTTPDQTGERASPASSQIGVTVTVLFNQRGTAKAVTTYTQIAERLISTPRVRSEADVRVLDVGSVTSGGVPLTLSAGLLHLKGAVSFESTATANLTAVSAGLATGEQEVAATTSTSAPPVVTTVATPAPAGRLGADCRHACWGTTQSSSFVASAENALPLVASSTAPAKTLITDAASNGISFVDDPAIVHRPELQLTAPLLRLDPAAASAPSVPNVCAAGPGTTPALSAGGYLTTTAPGASSLVEACAVARATPIVLFPTTFAPDGVVRIDLQRASVRCAIQGTAHASSATYDYQAVVKYWDGTGYSTAATIVPGQTNDALASVPLSTSVGGPRTLGDYITSWSSLTSGKVTKAETARAALLTLPGIVTIASAPLRPDVGSPTGFDESAVLSATVGVLSCRAEDRR